MLTDVSGIATTARPVDPCHRYVGLSGWKNFRTTYDVIVLPFRDYADWVGAYLSFGSVSFYRRRSKDRWHEWSLSLIRNPDSGEGVLDSVWSVVRHKGPKGQLAFIDAKRIASVCGGCLLGTRRVCPQPRLTLRVSRAGQLVVQA